MKKHLTLLSGASRGMGLAMAEQLCRPDQRLLCISRGTSERLNALVRQHGVDCVQWQADLAHPAEVAAKLSQWLDQQDPSELLSASLINNAGVIGHLGPIDSAAHQDLADALAINLQAP
ncbi:MAG: SDR family NAD(P)-dependent oxidoreductase, partial [Limnohabitans sp.]